MLRSLVISTAIVLAAAAASAEEPPDPNVIVLTFCHDPALISQCGKDTPYLAAVRAAFSASTECAGLTLRNDSAEAKGRWALSVDSYEPDAHGRYWFQLRTAVYAPKPWPSYAEAGTPREIVHRVCSIVGNHVGNVVE
jgi:hypothetical protein